MTLADLRKFSIRKQSRIRFRLRNGMECVISERGIAQVPELKSIPDFNLEVELASAQEFHVVPVALLPAKGKTPAPPPPISRSELAAMTSSGGAAGHSQPDHDDE